MKIRQLSGRQDAQPIQKLLPGNIDHANGTVKHSKGSKMSRKSIVKQSLPSLPIHIKSEIENDEVNIENCC
jgi:hypothetical protein